MKSNGRINLLDAPNPMVLYDKPSDYCEALTGNVENTILSRAFFSAKNQQIIQNAVRAGVYKMSNSQYTIAPQPFEQIQTIMRSVFLKNAKNLPENTRGQIEELNRLVVQYTVPKLYTEAKGYLRYLHDASTLVVPIAPPVNSVAYDKTLEMKPFFL